MTTIMMTTMMNNTTGPTIRRTINRIAGRKDRRHLSLLWNISRSNSSSGRQREESRMMFVSSSTNTTFTSLLSPPSLFYHHQQHQLTIADFSVRFHHGSAAVSADSVDFDEDDDSEDDATMNSCNSSSSSSKNHFELFSQPQTFRIDLVDLKRRYHKLMTEYHPDKQSQSSQSSDDTEGDDALLLSANDITDAYQTLISPHTRATYLLDEIYHKPLLEHDENDNMLVGMCFLMDMMEWRERIEELVSSDGDATTEHQQTELRRIRDETQARQQQCIENLNNVFDRLAELTPTSKQEQDDETTKEETLLQEARKYTAQLQYWNRLETTLREQMDL